MPYSPAMKPAASPLTGIRVIDFSVMVSGPMCTRWMADAGADVIKIEAPEGDSVRHRPPRRGGISMHYGALNCGKRSVVLDLRTAEGLEAARELVRTADVVVENFRPGVMKRLGLGYEEAAAINPRVVYCSVSGFGQSGPMAQAPAYAPVIHAASGYEMAHLKYQRGTSRPSNNGIHTADVLAGVHAFGALQLALFHRERTGQGQYIDVSMLDGVLGLLVFETNAAQEAGVLERPAYEPLRTSDGYIMIAAISAKNVAALFEAIGRPEANQDPRFADLKSREELHNWEAFLRLIEEWTMQRSGQECEDILRGAGVPCSRYRTVGEAMADPQVAARRLLAQVTVGDESFNVINPPYQFSKSPVFARDLVAGLGQHTEEVLGRQRQAHGLPAGQ